jgi:hypothetical protein
MRKLCRIQTDSSSDVGDRASGRGQYFRRLLNAEIRQEGVWGAPGRAAKRAEEMRPAEARHRDQIREQNIIGEAVAHQLDHPLQLPSGEPALGAETVDRRVQGVGMVLEIRVGCEQFVDKYDDQTFTVETAGIRSGHIGKQGPEKATDERTFDADAVLQP